MKKNLSYICVIILLALLLLLTGCSNVENEKTNNSTNFDELELDYNDASSFEKALNSGAKVNGKTVKFDVLEYKLDSLLGINCWSGEHLNFISDNELEVKTGDIIIGRVKEEPTSFLGSWKIKYDVIAIQAGTQGSDISEDITVEEFHTIENTTIENEETQYENTINNETVENVEANNTNVDNNKTNEETNKIIYNYYTTNDNETAKKGNIGKFAYIKRSSSYDVYWIIDFDEGYVYDFAEGNGDDYYEKIKIESGNLNDGLEVSYKNSSNAWVKYIHFKYKNQPHQLVIVDNDYFESSNEGHIMIAIRNTSALSVTLKTGERIAQGVFKKYLLIGNTPWITNTRLSKYFL